MTLMRAASGTKDDRGGARALLARPRLPAPPEPRAGHECGCHPKSGAAQRSQHCHGSNVCGFCVNDLSRHPDALTSPSDSHVRLFRNGRNQAVRIPRQFELQGDEAILRKEGNRLVIEPVRNGRLLALLGTLDPIEEPFADVDHDLAEADNADSADDLNAARGDFP